jgi:hypothetical protein
MVGGMGPLRSLAFVGQQPGAFNQLPGASPAQRQAQQQLAVASSAVAVGPMLMQLPVIGRSLAASAQALLLPGAPAAGVGMDGACPVSVVMSGVAPIAGASAVQTQTSNVPAQAGHLNSHQLAEFQYDQLPQQAQSGSISTVSDEMLPQFFQLLVQSQQQQYQQQQAQQQMLVQPQQLQQQHHQPQQQPPQQQHLQQQIPASAALMPFTSAAGQQPQPPVTTLEGSSTDAQEQLRIVFEGETKSLQQQHLLEQEELMKQHAQATAPSAGLDVGGSGGRPPVGSHHLLGASPLPLGVPPDPLQHPLVMTQGQTVPGPSEDVVVVVSLAPGQVRAPQPRW